jgi:flagellar hook-basal body complex protein FliE
MTIPAIPPIGAATTAAPERVAKPAAGFGEAMQRGLQSVSNLEHTADQLTTGLATGQDVKVHDVMVANTQASIGVELLTQVRNRALDAYNEIMRLPV